MLAATHRPSQRNILNCACVDRGRDNRRRLMPRPKGGCRCKGETAQDSLPETIFE